jgi:3-demethoxyubiquinol 3-hydroxylase
MEKKKLIEQMIRVDHAGEFGAKWIYEGQLRCLRDVDAKAKVQVMHDQELEHLNYFVAELQTRHVRPTALMPVWKMLGKAAGAISGRMGTQTAMACTQAVEEVIDKHYAKQIAKLEAEHPEETDLINTLKQFREDECEHKAEAESYLLGLSRQTLPKQVAKRLFQLGVKAAIKLSKRI